jgi:hypothetical protein
MNIVRVFFPTNDSPTPKLPTEQVGIFDSSGSSDRFISVDSASFYVLNARFRGKGFPW